MADKERASDWTSHDFPDVTDEREVYSGANVFDYPQERIPRDPGQRSGTEEMMEAVFSQPRRRG